jgi:hypothetical protein
VISIVARVDADADALEHDAENPRREHDAANPLRAREASRANACISREGALITNVPARGARRIPPRAETTWWLRRRSM